MEGKSSSLFILAGEPSGDLHGGHLVAQLRETGSNITIEGVAGPHMRLGGVTGPLAMEDFQVMGFTDVLKKLPKLYKHFRLLCNYIIERKPDCVAFIDYPGFNLRMAKALRKKGYTGKLVHYISPSVWAHGKGRIDVMAKNLDLLLTIYPFEAAHYSHTPLPVEYVGNPLCNYIDAYNYDTEWMKTAGLPEEGNMIGIFPGSRQEEIVRNLPVIIAAARKFHQKHPNVFFAVSCASANVDALVRAMIREKAPECAERFATVPKKWTYELMQKCKCAIAKSGTVTLELAIHGIPTAVVYKLTRLNKFIAQYILRLSLPYYCIVNILDGNEVFPELIAEEATPNKLFDTLENLYTNEIVRKQRIQACHIIRKRLGETNACANAASAITRLLA